jgi:tetratricopeptide (TPR) repeat protein
MAASSDWLRDVVGGMPPEPTFLRLSVRWAAELASALGAAHHAGLLHRDVKPSNVFITSDYRAVLIDFGIARRDVDPTLTSGVVGTPDYMAPEQARGSDAMGPPTDVYGLAATLYHLVTQRTPFEGDPGSVLLRVIEGNPSRASHWNRRLPTDVQAILDKGLERDPMRRYPSMAVFESDLRAFLDGRPVSVRPLSAVVRAGRRIARRPARSAAISAAILALTLGAVAVVQWSAEAARELTEEKMTLLAQLPARVGLEGKPEERPTFGADARQSNLALLDRILVLDPDDPAMLALRGALLLDRGGDGDHARAAEDMPRVAELGGTAYLREIAACHASADDTKKGAHAVDLSSVQTTPTTAIDRFIAAFEVMRQRAGRADQDYSEVAIALLDPVAAEYLPARDLKLLASLTWTSKLFERNQRTRGIESAVSLAFDATALEAAFGRPTARTRAVLGLSNIYMARYREAILALEQAIALSGDQHPEWMNLAEAHRHFGKPDKALDCLAHAERARPGYWRTRHSRALALADRGDYAGAWETAQSIDENESGPGLKDLLLGDLRLREGRSLLASDDPTKDPQRTSALLEEACALFDRAASALGNFGFVASRREEALAMLDDDMDRAAGLYAERAQEDPLHPYYLYNLAQMLPDEGLSAATCREIKTLLLGQTATIAPDLAVGQ